MRPEKKAGVTGEERRGRKGEGAELERLGEPARSILLIILIQWSGEEINYSWAIWEEEKD